MAKIAVGGLGTWELTDFVQLGRKTDGFRPDAAGMRVVLRRQQKVIEPPCYPSPTLLQQYQSTSLRHQVETYWLQ
ncbi:hypothetical protein [Hymenobacter jejuensis]|uniref:Uncharacterized protein n=1 Tax=Hymenobacter jejuensis TaxID=2502781 RepID=A0A5B8A024_9BACT|nr:hypothetical protein [Hymenobacter jejuensis]QDA60146.1 hypothetical protein FHG12_08510 [Hymenobacter jejuensis]